MSDSKTKEAGTTGTGSTGAGSAECERVDEAMAEILSGEASAELLEHLSECERCRDARFYAEQAADVAARSGADYEHRDDFAERVLAAIDAETANEREASAPTVEEAHSVVNETRHAETAPDEPIENTAPVPVTPAPEVRRVATAGSRNAGSSGAKPTVLFRVAGVALAAAALGVVYVATHSDGDSATGPTAEAALHGSWSGKVAKVAQAFGSKGGLTRCDSALAGVPCAPLVVGDVIPAGSVIKTDGLTRAQLAMTDGTVLTLDRGTSFELKPGERRARLGEGNLVADVHHIDGKMAVVELPQGRAEVLGTKFGLRATAELARVDVSRGKVRLVGDDDRDVSVTAGEGGQLFRGHAPTAEPTAALGSELAWSDEAFGRSTDEEIETRGLGELRAQKPGEDHERKGAVSLTRHAVKVRVVDNQARTEVEEIFTNHTDEVLEGIFRFPLPPDAQIERLALEVDGQLVEGAFADRDRASKIWRGAIVNAQRRHDVPKDEIIWVPGPWRDPALLEWQRGGRFELRIFPIPKQGSRRIVLAYTQTIAPSGETRRYSYPLAHDPSGTTGALDFQVDVEVRGHDAEFPVVPGGVRWNALDGTRDVARFGFHETAFVPGGDLTLEYRLPDSKAELRAWAYQPTSSDVERERVAQAQGRSTGGGSPFRSTVVTDAPSAGVDSTSPESAYVALSLKPKLPRWTDDAARAFVIVVDRSRSMYGEQYRRASALAAKIVEELDRKDQVLALACDSTCSQAWSSFREPGVEAATDLRMYLGGQTPEGASDVSGAIVEALRLGELAGDRALRIVYVGDGTPTVGPIDPAFITREISPVLSAKASVFAVTVGSDNDVGALGAITRAAGGAVLPYAPGQTIAEAAYATLAASYGNALRDVRLELPPGLTEVAPTHLGTIAAGQEATIVARMNAPSVQGEVVLRGKVGEREFEQRYPLNVAATSAAGNAFVPRLFATEHIRALENESGAWARDAAVSLSSRFNVASRYTSLLVLESAAMFQAFGLDNTRSAPLWTGEEDAVASESKSESSLAEEAANGYGRGGLAGIPADATHYGSLGSGGGMDVRSSRGFPGAAAAPPPASAPMPAKKSAATRSRADDWEGSQGELAKAKERGPVDEPWLEREEDRAWQMPEPRRIMIPMRKIWERAGTLRSPSEIPKEGSVDALVQAEARVRDNPLSREALKALYVGYLLAGDVERAADAAERWSEKDPLDADALTARADVAAERGDRDLAIRILGSVVDVRPGDHKAQWRLARLHRWAGRAVQGCRHSLAVAQIRRSDVKLLTEATRCARDSGQSALVEQLLGSFDPRVRAQVETELRNVADVSGRLVGDFQVTATWDGARHDLDLVLVHPDGYRISWLGAPTRSVITATDVLSAAREGLALEGAKVGTYALEIVRASSATGAVRGTVEVLIGKEKEQIPFLMEGGRLRLATVNVHMRSRLVPL